MKQSPGEALLATQLRALKIAHTPEFRFHDTRKWRFDFAHLPSKTAVEVEGKVWGGRHTRGDGFMADAEKYFEAHIRGWRVVRLTPNLITPENLRALAMRMSI